MDNLLIVSPAIFDLINQQDDDVLRETVMKQVRVYNLKDVIEYELSQQLKGIEEPVQQ